MAAVAAAVVVVGAVVAAGVWRSAQMWACTQRGGGLSGVPAGATAEQVFDRWWAGQGPADAGFLAGRPPQDVPRDAFVRTPGGWEWWASPDARVVVDVDDRGGGEWLVASNLCTRSRGVLLW